MTPNQIICGDVLYVLRGLPDNSVDMCVTSPPYWGLRDYGVSGQLGLEKTPQEYVDKMVLVFRHVRRVLKPCGTLWLNLGDSYAGNATGTNSQESSTLGGGKDTQREAFKRPDKTAPGLKPKDLVGIPWRVAFALQADGRYLRQDIIWAKPNPMPESVRDRCTKSHEYLFLLSKSGKYYFDHEAIKEPAATEPHAAGYVSGDQYAVGPMDRGGNSQREGDQTRVWAKNGLRNRRDVWTIPTQPYPEAHFATFPSKLIEPCILAGCPKGGIVLDPFMGSGTTAQVAKALGRNYLGIELNPAYITLIQKRIDGPAPKLNTVGVSA